MVELVGELVVGVIGAGVFLFVAFVALRMLLTR